MQENLAYPKETLAPVDIKELVPEKSTRVLPPYNGYGSLADSAENCKHLIPKPPKKDFYKLINKSKIVLRFGSQFLCSNRHPVSEDHRYDPCRKESQQKRKDFEMREALAAIPPRD